MSQTSRGMYLGSELSCGSSEILIYRWALCFHSLIASESGGRPSGVKRGQRQKPEGPRERRVGRPQGACQPREEGPLGSEARSPEGEEAASRDTVELGGQLSRSVWDFLQTPRFRQPGVAGHPRWRSVPDTGNGRNDRAGFALQKRLEVTCPAHPAGPVPRGRDQGKVRETPASGAKRKAPQTRRSR